MSLTPLEVKKQEFEKVFRGYDPVAVDAFLELVSEEMAVRVLRIAALEERLEAVSSTVEDYRQMEHRLKETLTGAERQAQEARDAAVRDADLHKREAKLESERILADAERRRASLEQRMEELENREREFLRRLKSFLDEHRRTLEDHPLIASDRDAVGRGKDDRSGE